MLQHKIELLLHGHNKDYFLIKIITTYKYDSCLNINFNNFHATIINSLDMF